MRTARSADYYHSCLAPEDENILIANYWLEFVSARDDRECKVSRPQGEELHSNIQTFTHRINTILETQEKLRKTLNSVQPETACEPPSAELSPAHRLENLGDRPASESANPCSQNELPGMAGPFARGRQFVSNCLRDSFVLDVLEKMS